MLFRAHEEQSIKPKNAAPKQAAKVPVAASLAGELAAAGKLAAASRPLSRPPPPHRRRMRRRPRRPSVLSRLPPAVRQVPPPFSSYGGEGGGGGGERLGRRRPNPVVSEHHRLQLRSRFRLPQIRLPHLGTCTLFSHPLPQIQKDWETRNRIRSYHRIGSYD